MKRGFAIVSAVLLVLLLLVLGGAGYTGYKYFTEENFDFYGLMPMAAEEIDEAVQVVVEDEIAERDEDVTGVDDEGEKDKSIMDLFSGGAVNARDAGKKADVNYLIIAIETYNNDYMGYPQKSVCVDQMDELDEYLITGDKIFEEGGRAVFETEDGSVLITCEGGHLYQSFGEGAYMLWTTMENEENGNMQYFMTNQGDVVKGDEGRYFVVNKANNYSMEMLPYEGEDVAPVEKTGVPRGVSRGTE